MEAKSEANVRMAHTRIELGQKAIVCKAVGEKEIREYLEAIGANEEMDFAAITETQLEITGVTIMKKSSIDDDGEHLITVRSHNGYGEEYEVPLSWLEIVPHENARMGDLDEW